MIEHLFIISAVLITMLGAQDVDNCIQYQFDIVELMEVESGITEFTYKGNEMQMQIMTTGKIPKVLMSTIGYYTQIEGCVIK